jgi:hypothetical protein
MRKGKSVEILADYVPTEGVDYISLETWNELDKDDPIRSYDCSNAPCTRTKDGDQMNTHPSNLYWKWTRERRNFTAQQALERTKDKYLIEYYTSGDKKVLKRGINNVFEKIYGKIDSEFIGELYITIQNYADRNLLFDLEKDIIGTYIGLKKQQFRKQVKTVSLSKFGDKTNIIADYE